MTITYQPEVNTSHYKSMNAKDFLDYSLNVVVKMKGVANYAALKDRLDAMEKEIPDFAKSLKSTSTQEEKSAEEDNRAKLEEAMDWLSKGVSGNAVTATYVFGAGMQANKSTKTSKLKDAAAVDNFKALTTEQPGCLKLSYSIVKGTSFKVVNCFLVQEDGTVQFLKSLGRRGGIIEGLPSGKYATVYVVVVGNGYKVGPPSSKLRKIVS